MALKIYDARKYLSINTRFALSSSKPVGNERYSYGMLSSASARTRSVIFRIIAAAAALKVITRCRTEFIIIFFSPFNFSLSRARPHTNETLVPFHTQSNRHYIIYDVVYRIPKYRYTHAVELDVVL